MSENTTAIDELRRFWSHTSHLRIDHAIQHLARAIEEHPEDALERDEATLLVARALVRQSSRLSVARSVLIVG